MKRKSSQTRHYSGLMNGVKSETGSFGVDPRLLEGMSSKQLKLTPNSYTSPKRNGLAFLIRFLQRDDVPIFLNILTHVSWLSKSDFWASFDQKKLSFYEGRSLAPGTYGVN